MKKRRNSHVKTRKKKYVGGDAGSDFLETVTNIAKKSTNVIDKWVPRSIIRDFVGDGFANKEWSVVAPNLLNNINETVELVTYAAKDPELRKVLEDSIEVYGVALIEIFQIAKPVIYKLTEEFWVMIDEIGTKSVSGAINAGVETFSAAIAEVPGLGGAVDAVIALAKWFNAVASGITAPTTVFSGQLSGKTFKFGRDTWAFHSQHGEELSKAYTNVTNVLKDAKKYKPDEKESNTPVISGGSRRNANKTLHRIKNSINRFTKKHPIKPG